MCFFRSIRSHCKYRLHLLVFASAIIKVLWPQYRPINIQRCSYKFSNRENRGIFSKGSYSRYYFDIEFYSIISICIDILWIKRNVFIMPTYSNSFWTCSKSKSFRAHTLGTSIFCACFFCTRSSSKCVVAAFTQLHSPITVFLAIYRQLVPHSREANALKYYPHCTLSNSLGWRLYSQTELINLQYRILCAQLIQCENCIVDLFK